MDFKYLLKLIIVAKFVHIFVEVLNSINNLDMVLFSSSFFCFFCCCYFAYSSLEKFKVSFSIELISEAYFIANLVRHRLWDLKNFIYHNKIKSALRNRFFIFMYLYVSNIFMSLKNKVIFLSHMNIYINLFLNNFLKKLKLNARLSNKVFNYNFMLFS